MEKPKTIRAIPLLNSGLIKTTKDGWLYFDKKKIITIKKADIIRRCGDLLFIK